MQGRTRLRKLSHEKQSFLEATERNDKNNNSLKCIRP